MKGRPTYDIDTQAVDDYAVRVVDNAAVRAIIGNYGETVFGPQGLMIANFYQFSEVSMSG